MERMERTARSHPAGFAAHGTAEHDAPPWAPAWDVFDLPASTLESLRGEIGALRERLAHAAPKRAVVEMDRAISLLCRRVDDMRAAGGAGDDRAIAEELAAIRLALARLDQGERFRALEAGVEAMARRIDLVGARAVDPVEVARLQGQIDELHDLVQRAVAAPHGQEALQKLSARLALCAEEVAQSGAEGARRLTEAAGAFERHTDTLLRRVAEMAAQARLGDADAAEDLRQTLLAAFDGIHHRLDRMSGQIAEQGAGLSPAAGADIAQRLGALAARFHHAEARLERLDHMDACLRALADETHGLSETARHAAAEVAAEVATEVAADAAAAVAAKGSADPNGAAMAGLKRGLAALEARQDEMERRAGELYAAEMEQEFAEMSVALDRDGDGTYAPRAPTAAPRAAAAPVPEPAPAKPEPPMPDQEALERLLRAATAPEAPWPRASRRVDLGRGTANTDSTRPRLDPRPKRADRPHGRPSAIGLFASFLSRRRHVAMVALIAGSTTVFAGMAMGVAWQNGPELASGMTAALRRLAAPAIAGVSPAELPSAIGPSALRTAAQNGDPAAAFLVAGRYAEGRGTEMDLDAAVKWLGYAVQRGSAPAALRLGTLYESAGKDMTEARRLYTWAAEQGNVRAMHALAMLLSDGSLPGLGGKPDWAGALKWFRASAELGHRDSQYNLGVLYARGLGVKADVAEAWKWLNLAAMQGDEDSARKRDMLSRDADALTLVRAQQASATFVPATPLAAANMVEVKPEWQDPAPAGAVGVSAAPAAARRVASSTAAGR